MSNYTPSTEEVLNAWHLVCAERDYWTPPLEREAELWRWVEGELRKAKAAVLRDVADFLNTPGVVRWGYIPTTGGQGVSVDEGGEEASGLQAKEITAWLRDLAGQIEEAQ